ncbi:MAG TPA: type II toxin-antitoxin system VapC family toxin [Chthoniobacterales bacterium]
MSYWDTSALVKLYLMEPDSARFEALALVSPVVIGMIARHELRTVFRRREAEAAIPAREASALYYQRLTSDTASGLLRLQPDSETMEREFGKVLETCFSQTPPVFIRTNDALHLAAARVAGETEFVTADMRQRAAAELLGFKLLP